VAIILLAALALAPPVFIASEVAAASRDVAYWDEVDTALSLVLQLNSGLGWPDFFARIFDVSNEHRMVTSRMIFAASYWLTGTINFAIIGWLGNAALAALCVMLVYAVGTTPRRLTMALLLSMLMFQFQHFENFLWSGASIDHFQVVFLAGAAVMAVARGSRLALLAGALFALLATFTLAHGILTWVLGIAILWHQRRFRHLAIWAAIGTLAVGGFLAGFQFNGAQRYAEFSPAGAWIVLLYWLTLLGSLPALGNFNLAPWLGVALLIGIGAMAFTGAARREPVTFPIMCFAVMALALIAIGRAVESGAAVQSRYYVLGALAWGLLLFMLLDGLSSPRHGYVPLLSAVPLLVAFNITANHRFGPKADSWIECRDRAALRFKEHGVDGRGVFALYPVPARSTHLLNEAERRAVYRMAPICEERSFPHATQSTRISYYVDEMNVTPHSAALAGWAAIPGVPAERGQVHLVLRSGQEMHVFTTVTISRPDVAAALTRTDAVLAGFRFARRRDQLPTGQFQVGILIEHDGKAEYIMTGHRLSLIGDGQALLASSN
jgi:hypothetical protein